MSKTYLFDLKYFFKCLSKSQNNSFFIVQQKNVQKQKGSTDCGLFSLAYMASICNGTDPSYQRFMQKDMRSHFNNCARVGKFEPFPSEERSFRGNELTFVFDCSLGDFQ